jgi:urea transport system ATP-binding protein
MSTPNEMAGARSRGANPGPSAVAPRSGTAIYISGLSVTFSGFAAITNLSMEFRYGEIRAVIGPNGAGKTTLMDVITGKTKPASGEVFLDKTIDLASRDETDIARLGIGRKFQKPSVFDALLVRENLELAVRNGRGYGAMLRSRLDAAQHTRIDEVLETIGLAVDAGRLAGTLSHGQKQWLEIGMLLVADPRVILLDEPVAGMTDHETARTAELIAGLKSPERAVVVIEHDMDFVGEIADLVSVLHEGRLLGEGSMESVRNDPRVIQVYLGR